MEQQLSHLKKQLILIATISFALTPIIGYSIALSFEMLSPDALLAYPGTLILFGSCLFLLAAQTVHFMRYLSPIMNWISTHPEQPALPEVFQSRLNNFTDNYWAFFLIYALSIPTIQHWYGLFPNHTTAYSSLLQFILLQLVITIMVGMPGYLLSLNTLGKLANYFGHTKVHASIRTRMLLIGGYLPVLCTTIMLKYYWWQTGFLSAEIILAWALMGISSFTLVYLTIRSLKQSLEPVHDLIANSGASNYMDLAKRLRPKSIDEIGSLVQTLGRLFHRLSDQESHMHAVVDNAAEGIIVVSEDRRIETFNPAAETLFGYHCHEVRGEPLSLLLPEILGTSSTNFLFNIEQETIGRDKSGHELAISIRMSKMHMNGEDYFTCMVADISDRKLAENKLVEAEARYRNLVTLAHDLVWSMDTEGRWTFLNNAVTRIYGYQPDEMIGQPFTHFQAPESIERDEEAIQNLQNGQELLNFETVHLDKEGERRHISFNAKPHMDDNGKLINIMGTARDITAQKAFEHELTYQAQHDALTGLHNRNYFMGEMERLLTRVARSGTECAMLYLDLDQFKYVNDTLGHAAGDRLLIECTGMLRNHIREGDLLARFGGDEFTVLLYNVDTNAAQRVAEHIRDLFEHYRYLEDGKSFNITCSIGVSMITSDSITAEDVLLHADLACNIAKTQGRNCVHLSTSDDKEKDGMAEDIGWATRVRDAYEQDRFGLVYQPIMSIADNTVQDYEVLLRMSLKNGDVIMPGGFMPAAERFGLINQVDRWTVGAAMKQLAELHDNKQFVRFAINLSGRAFEDKQLLPMIQSILRDSNIDPSAVTFEITESAAISNLSAATDFIFKLKDIGCQFALDDFGTGFSSFAYLKHLPVDKLKIDGSFVRGLAESSVDQAMVKSMNQIAHALNKQTIAEFVENKDTLHLLKEFGIDYAQGHFLGRPESRDAENAWPSVTDRHPLTLVH
ncbi:MAG: EAL domain-containing protein [Gammaproteobacteria bacterium]|nr:EAL domain-containing protein [Gammaproteobacteria bacterium]